jgi:flagellar motility protein MotE (MotC chaperone)
MLKILVISLVVLMASAGQASAPPSPRGGRKPSPSQAPATEAAAPAESPAATTPPSINGSPPAVEPPAAEAASVPAATTAKTSAPVARKAHKPSKPRNKAEREQLLESAGVERVAPAMEVNATNGPIPPSLSSTALRQEMAAGRGPGGAPSEREKMEALSADLARARAALQAETARLEALLKKPGGAAGAEAPAGEAPMPVGDPLAATRPAASPAAANQVDVVSKALKGMKPEQAAAIIGHLNRGLAADVLQKMRPADAGVILGFLKPELGAALATEIANREPPRGKPGDKVKP